jgi:hypothetical protein
MAQLTPEELKQITDLQTQYNRAVFELGSVEAQLNGIVKKLEEDKTNTLESIKKLNSQEQDLIEALQAKYGAGSLNIETGEIVPV